MNSLLFQISSYSALCLLQSARSIASSSFYGHCSNLSWKKITINPSVKSIDLRSFVLARFGVVQCYSSKRSSSRKRKSCPEPVMEDEKDAFFVVRKGNIVGVYKSLSECQAQVGSSISNPPVSVYKGHNLPKDAEEHLHSYGLHNALYTIRASDLKDDLFGTLVPCVFQEPSSTKGETSSMDFLRKRPHDLLGSGNLVSQGTFESISTIDPLNKHQKLDDMSSDIRSCTLEFDGASKGNPGQAGAGAVLRALNGRLICKIRQGLGMATNNVAEYRAIILGLKKALEMGYTGIRAQGDSKLVCMQLQGLWKVKNQNMSDLHAEAMKLKDKFSSFQISHVLRDLNSAADAQANLAISLADGQVQEDLC